MLTFGQITLIYFSIGDWGALKNTIEYCNMKMVAETIGKYSEYYHPQFIVSLGDNFYKRGVKSVDDEKWNTVWYNNFVMQNNITQSLKWMCILGNHDYCSGSKGVQAQLQKTYTLGNNWHMPNHNYAFHDKKSNSFHIFIDTCQLYPELYIETMQLCNKESRKRSLIEIEDYLIEANIMKCKFICVYGHYHIFSNGYYANYEVMKEHLCPLFDKYNVDFYFSGHEHNFQILKNNNTYFVINGAGSFSSEVHLTNKDKDVDTIYVNNNNGFCIHTIKDNTFSVKFINTDSIIEHELFIIK